MLDNLLEIEIAYNLLKAGDDSAKDPIDIHYQRLRTDIQVMLYVLEVSKYIRSHREPCLCFPIRCRFSCCLNSP